MTSPCIQGERLASLETSLKLTDKATMEKLNTMDEKIDNNHIEIKTMIKEMTTTMKTDFASKWVEVALKWAIGLIMGIVISAIVYQVIIK